MQKTTNKIVNKNLSSVKQTSKKTCKFNEFFLVLMLYFYFYRSCVFHYIWLDLNIEKSPYFTYELNFSMFISVGKMLRNNILPLKLTLFAQRINLMNNVKHLFSQVKKNQKKPCKFNVIPKNQVHQLDLLAKYINSPKQELNRILSAATKAQEKFERAREKLETIERAQFIYNLPSETKKSLAFIVMGRKALPVLNFSQGNMAKLIGVSIRTISNMLLKDVDINLITGKYERIANRHNLGSFWDRKEAFLVIKDLCNCLPEFYTGTIFSKLPTTYTKIIAKIVYKMRDYIKNNVKWINFDEIYRSGVPTKEDFLKSEETEENNYGFSIPTAGVVRPDSAYEQVSLDKRKSMREEMKEWACSGIPTRS